VGWLDNHHILLWPSLEKDYLLLWLKNTKYLMGFPMRVLKWSKNFKYSSDSPIVLLWVSFENLLVFSVAFAIGKPLEIDKATTLSRPSVARVSIKIYLLKPNPR
jgi:hypothetical protein